MDGEIFLDSIVASNGPNFFQGTKKSGKKKEKFLYFCRDDFLVYGRSDKN